MRFSTSLMLILIELIILISLAKCLNENLNENNFEADLNEIYDNIDEHINDTEVSKIILANVSICLEKCKL